MPLQTTRQSWAEIIFKVSDSRGNVPSNTFLFARESKKRGLVRNLELPNRRG